MSQLKDEARDRLLLRIADTLCVLLIRSDPNDEQGNTQRAVQRLRFVMEELRRTP